MTRAYRDPDGGLWLTTSQAAERMQVSPKTVHRYVAEGRFNHVHKTLGGHARLSTTEVDALIAELTYQPDGEDR